MSVRPFWRAALIYAALTVVMAWPFSVHPSRGVVAMGTDTDLPIWTLAWDVHAFTHQPFSIFDANIFFPFRHTLAYSENLIGSAFLAAPIIWISQDPLLAMNVIVLFSIAVSGLGAYLLARRLGLSETSALLAGVVFAFSPPRFLRLDQFHLTTIQWVPFTLAYLHTYFETGRARDLRIAVAFFSLQALTSGHGGAFLVLGILLVLAAEVLRRTPIAPMKRLGDFGIVGALLLLPTILVFIPYRAAQVEVGLRRVLDDWSVSASSFVTSASRFQTFVVAHAPDWTWLKQPPDAWLFPGFLPLLLVVPAVLRRRWQGDDGGGRVPAFVWCYFAVALVCAWFVVGPPYGVWRWVYWLPGLNFVRVPSRFWLLGVLALGVLAAAGFERVTRRLQPRSRLAAGVLGGALLLGEFAVLPIDVHPYRVEIPSIDRWARTLPPRAAIVEVPVPDSLDVVVREQRNTRYMLHSIGHFRPIFQGFSGIQPPGYEDVHWQLTTFPDERSLRTLTRLGFTHAILHTDLVPPTERADVEDRFVRFREWVRLEAVIGAGRAYSLHWPKESGSQK